MLEIQNIEMTIEMIMEMLKLLGPMGATIVVAMYLWVNSRKGDAKNEAALNTLSLRNDQRIEDMLRQVAEMSVKVNTIWETYVLDALKMSQRSGMTRTGSPLQPSETWSQMLPDDLRDPLGEYIEQVAAVEHTNPDDIALQAWVHFRKPLTRLLSEHEDLTAAVIIGILTTIAQNCKDRRT